FRPLMNLSPLIHRLIDCLSSSFDRGHEAGGFASPPRNAAHPLSTDHAKLTTSMHPIPYPLMITRFYGLGTGMDPESVETGPSAKALRRAAFLPSCHSGLSSLSNMDGSCVPP